MFYICRELNNKDMDINGIKLNWKDIQFILGIPESESKRLVCHIVNAGYETDFKPSEINARINVEVGDIKYTFNSPDPKIHGNPKVYTIIKGLIENDIPNSMKRKLYANEKCILNGRICGVFNTLNKILTINQRIKHGENLKRIKTEFLAFNTPQKVTKYNISEEEQDVIDLISNKIFDYEEK